MENLKYYHITETKNKISILKTGIRCNEEGYIFLFENKSISYNGIINTIADCIAKNQIFLDRYVMFEIDSKGFQSELLPDEVGELSHKQQWILKQEKINPEFINLFGVYETQYIIF
ncbi:MAG: hypothetical protein LC109_11100 [Bacteroidia bacterium]|nr:hypothetical protein [Bacteroidia bacterium]